MVDFRDCTGRLAATGDAKTGLVENRYKGQKTKALLRKADSLFAYVGFILQMQWRRR